MTIKEVAKIAGVSVTTVSLILNNKQIRVSDEIKNKVIKIAKETNYQPNYCAVGLVKKSTRTIGVVVPDIENMFFSKMIKSIQNIMLLKGYNILLCDSNGDANYEHSLIEQFINRGCDGIMASFSPNNCYDVNKLFSDNKIPFVAIDTWEDSYNCTKVSTDHYHGTQLLIEYLLKNGHNRIGLITGNTELLSVIKRLMAYKDELAKFGIEFDRSIVKKGDFTFESGYSSAKQLLSEGVNVIVAMNDMMAYGTYKAISETNLKIGEDVSVVGFDDVVFSSMLSIPLTTIKQPIEKICKIACDKLFDELSGKKEKETIYVEPELVIRSSVKTNCNR